MKRFLISALLLSTPIFAAGGYFSTGSIVSRCVNISCGAELEENGSMEAFEQINLFAGSIAGKGLLKAPIINITVDEFNFHGTIDCSTACVIHASQPFDEKCFKRTGGGTFNIVVP